MSDIEEMIKRENARYQAICEARSKLDQLRKDHAYAAKREESTGIQYTEAKLYREGLDARIQELEASIKALLDSHA